MEHISYGWLTLPAVALLGGFLGWLLREYQLKGKIVQYEADIQKRDTQLLNTSNQLDADIKQKDEHINKMVAEINSLKANNANLNNQLSASATHDTTAETLESNAVKTTHDLVSSEDDDVELVESGEEGQDAVDGFEVNMLPLEAQVEDTMLGDILKLKKKLKRRKRRIRSLKVALTKLSTENTSLLNRLKVAGKKGK